MWFNGRAGDGGRHSLPLASFVMARKRELWWHVYLGACPHMGGNIKYTLGKSTMHPELLLQRGHVTLPSGMGCECTVDYLRSFDHEPTAEEEKVIEEVQEDRYAGFWAEQVEA